LNGLGYAYFSGFEVEKNQTKAFEYFLRSASTSSDGDSFFNAAYCLDNGFGTPVNHTWASELYRAAAESFGHFDSVHMLGMYAGKGRDKTMVFAPFVDPI